MPRVKIGPPLPDRATLDVEIARLRDLDVTELRRHWQAGFGRPAPPHLARHLLCHRQWETDPSGTLNLTHRFRWFLREGGADAEAGGADGIGCFEEARG